MTRYCLGSVLALALGAAACSEPAMEPPCENVEDCHDGNECTEDSCEADGSCGYAAVSDGSLCDAGYCEAGQCQPIDSIFPCTEQGIRDAIAEGGGPHAFDCSGPTEVPTQSEIAVDNDVILDGRGKLIVDGGDTHRVFSVLEGVTAELTRLTVSRGRVEFNSEEEGAGILNAGTLALVNSTVKNNVGADWGSGISNDGTLAITDSTVSSNSGEFGAGVASRGALEIVGSTLVGNGIANGGTLRMVNSTVSAKDSGLGGALIGSGPTSLVSCTIRGSVIVAPPEFAEAPFETSGTIFDGGCEYAGGGWTSLGYNVESGYSRCGLDHPTDQTRVDATDLALRPLADNGGPTQTHALDLRSVAFDAIPAEECVTSIDQRGLGRPQGFACDVGAFEIERGSDLCEGIECSDGNECTANVCNPKNGKCEYPPVEDGEPCASGAGVCGAGSCAATFACTEDGIRNAIRLGGGPHVFDCDGPTTLDTGSSVYVDKDVILDGEGQITLDAGDEHTGVRVQQEVTAELRGFEITKGADAGISNEGTLTLRDCVVSDSAGVQGGGISSSGPLTLVRSTVSGNTSTYSWYGGAGGIESSGPLTLVESIVTGNTSEGVGGGILARGGLSMTDTTVSENVAQRGGGVFVAAEAPVLILNSTVADNTGGAVLSGRFDCRQRAALIAAKAEGDTLTIENSTISDSDRALDVATFCYESALPVLIYQSTIVGTLYTEGTRSVAGSTVQGSCEGSEDTMSLGHNVESPGDTCGFDQPTDQVNVSADDLKLEPLADNGGPTETHALGDGSVAIDVIPEADCVGADNEPLTTDQRGVERPQGTACDVGAVEMEVTP